MVSIKKNIFYSSILTTANYLFPLLTFPYVSRVLGVTNIGIVNFVDSIIHYFILISMMGIGIVGIREVAKNKGNEEKLNQAFSGLFWLNTITTIIAIIILIVVTVWLEQLRIHWHLMLIGILKLLMNYMLIEWLYKGLEEFKYITIRTLIIKSLYVVSVFMFVRHQEDYPIYYFLMVMMIVVNSVINIFYSRHFVSLRCYQINIAKYLRPFLTLGLYNLLNSMYLSVNVSWLGFVSGGTEVGYYTTASKLHNILIAMFTAFTGVMLPRMSALLAEGKIEEFKEKLRKANSVLFTFSIPLVIFTVIYAPAIIYIIAGAGYEGAIAPMRIMMPLILVIGYEQILIVQALIPLGKDNAILKNSVAGAITGLLLNILLVSAYASIGASIVWLGSEIVVLCSAQYHIKKYIGVHFPWRSLSKNILIYFPLIVLLLLICTSYDGFISLSVSFVVMIIYLIIINTLVIPNPEIKQEIGKGYRFFKRWHNG